MKKITSLALAALLLVLTVIPATATGIIPYDSYIYDFWEDIVLTPAPYVPGRSVTGVSVGAGAFSGPQGMAVGPDGRVYIADTGNDRIVVINAEMTQYVSIIEEFYNDGAADTFRSPFGVAICRDNLLYVADSLNARIVVLDGDAVVEIIDDPQSEMLDPGFVFTPLKVAVDYAGRVYVIARGMFQGIMVFNPDGDFTGFFGTINVQITPWEIFWRMISTRAQINVGRQFIPTEFTGVDVDPDGFLYASNVDPAGEQAVRRLNPSGEDVIRRGENENLGGDLVINPNFSMFSGPSVMVDVVYRGKGIYSLLDSKRGRIFSYDREGNLLYIFGGLGNQAGNFRQPVAIEAFGNQIAVLDALRNEIMVFEETLYGQLINEAVGLRFDGDETMAVEKWRQVLVLNENLEIANIGIGKAYLTAGDNLSAMRYLQMGQDRTFYSVAFKRYRNDVLKENMAWILTSVVVLAIGIPITVSAARRRKKRKEEEEAEWG
ncbi:MAG: NHL repeat-containing protein [Oscillospiraceae bacterium]|nr:NHL repeat-containing protein [Oscillospiraceae bacterium]